MHIVDMNRIRIERVNLVFVKGESRGRHSRASPVIGIMQKRCDARLDEKL